jgi:hypothetical protein
MELHVLAEESRLPDASRWQEAISALGFDLKLDQTLSVREQTGLLPCTFKAQQSGFGFDIFPATDIVDTYPEFKKAFLGRDSSANFRWGGDMVEMACALIASTALAKVSDGVWFDPQDGVCLTPREALEKMKSDLAAAEL